MRICIVYDCLFPWTVGGAERWYRNLAERLAADGHEVTYLTRLQWDIGDEPQIPGVQVVAVSRADDLYGPGRQPADRAAAALRPRRPAAPAAPWDGVRRRAHGVLPVLLGARRGGGAAARRLPARRRLARGLERELLARVPRRPSAGASGYAVQRRCVRVRHTRVLLLAPARGAAASRRACAATPTLLDGLYAGRPDSRREPREAEPLVVFAGRHIPEKRVPAVVAAIARARARGLDVRGLILGDGPERAGGPARRSPRAGSAGRRRGAGLRRRRRRGRRAAARAVPACNPSVARGLRTRGRRGVGARHAGGRRRRRRTTRRSSSSSRASTGSSRRRRDPDALADAIAAVHEAGPALRERTCAWFGGERRAAVARSGRSPRSPRSTANPTRSSDTSR